MFWLWRDWQARVQSLWRKREERQDVIVGATTNKTIGGGVILRKEQCLACSGTGYPANPICPTCDGNGSYTCRTCTGSGDLICDLCQGRGEITQGRLEQYKRHQRNVAIGCIVAVVILIIIIVVVACSKP